MVKNMANFCENRKNHGKDTASNYRPEDHYRVYKTQHLVLTTIITCSARFSSVKFCHHGHILSQYVTKHADFGSRGKGKVNIFVLNSHNKLQLMLIKKKIFL